MRRRDFIAGLGGAATSSVSWQLAAGAQERVRRIGVLMNLPADDPEGQSRNAALLRGLQELGWIDGRNIKIDYRWGADSVDRTRRHAAELAALTPDVLVASGGTAARALQQAIHTVPIVFAQVTDPVGGGLVASLAQPGGNATGFTQFEYGLSGKWLELLKQIAPNVTRVAIIRDPTNPAAIGQFAAIQAVAPSLGVELRPADARQVEDIERVVTASGGSNGIIVVTGISGALYRDPIIKLAARVGIPAVYSARYFVQGGGLISYGPDTADPFRQAAGYVDRILKGEKPADLPVQAPTKYDLVVNLKTAKALGLTVPPTVLARADEVIE